MDSEINKMCQQKITTVMLSNDSDDRLATEIVTEVGEGRGKVPIFMPGSKFTALSCVPTHKQSIRCPPIDCKKRTGELP